MWHPRSLVPHRNPRAKRRLTQYRSLQPAGARLRKHSHTTYGSSRRISILANPRRAMLASSKFLDVESQNRGALSCRCSQTERRLCLSEDDLQHSLCILGLTNGDASRATSLRAVLSGSRWLLALESKSRMPTASANLRVQDHGVSFPQRATCGIAADHAGLRHHIAFGNAVYLWLWSSQMQCYVSKC
ncbi:hypothetical protein LZ30DRAFT_10947 [Colletotrichum cereale]|nr:hypothetical protein LZ30DRAFT_10947 [Colletotrichum cereale]